MYEDKEDDSVISVNSRMSIKSNVSKSRGPGSGHKVVPVSGANVPSLVRQLDIGEASYDGSNYGDGFADDVSVVSEISVATDGTGTGSSHRSSRASKGDTNWISNCLIICQAFLCPRWIICTCLKCVPTLPIGEFGKALYVVLFNEYACRSGLVFLMLGLACSFMQVIFANSPQYNPIVMLVLLTAVELPQIPVGMRSFILLSLLTAGSIVLDFAYLLDSAVPGVTKILVSITIVAKLYTLMEVLTYANRASKARKFLYRRLRVFGVGFTVLPYRLLRDIRYRILALGIIAMIGTTSYFIMFLVGITSLSLDDIVSGPAVGMALSTFLLIKTFTSFAQVAWILTDTDVVLFMGTFGMLGYFMKYYRAHVLRRREELGGWPLVYAFNSLRVKILACLKTMDALFGIAGWVTLSTCTGTCFLASPDNLQAFIVALVILLLFTDIWGSVLMYYVLSLIKELRLQRGIPEGGYDPSMEDSDNSELDELGLRDAASVELRESRRKAERRQRKLEKVERRADKQRAKMGKIQRSAVKRREKTAVYQKSARKYEVNSESSDNSGSSGSDSSGESSSVSGISDDSDDNDGGRGGGRALLASARGRSTHNPVHDTGRGGVRRRSPHGSLGDTDSQNTPLAADRRFASRPSRAGTGGGGGGGSLMDDENLPAYMTKRKVSPCSESPRPVDYLHLATRYETEGLQGENGLLSSPLHEPATPFVAPAILSPNTAPPAQVPVSAPSRPVVSKLNLSALTNSYTSLVASESKQGTHGGRQADSDSELSSSDDETVTPVLVRMAMPSTSRRPPRLDTAPPGSARGTPVRDRLVLDLNTAPMEMERFSELWEAYAEAGEVSHKVAVKDGVTLAALQSTEKVDDATKMRIPLSLVMKHFKNIGVYVVAYADYGRAKKKKNARTETRCETARLFSVTQGTYNGEEVNFLLEMLLLYDVDKATSVCTYKYKCSRASSADKLVENLRLKYIFNIS